MLRYTLEAQPNLIAINGDRSCSRREGFAVVVDEIRKLAESSGVQSKTIGVVLKR
jgi:hypothetical protein